MERSVSHYVTSLGELVGELGQAHVVLPVHDAPVRGRYEQVLLSCGLDAVSRDELLHELVVVMLFYNLRVVV